jgi:hypothetical protein
MRVFQAMSKILLFLCSKSSNPFAVQRAAAIFGAFTIAIPVVRRLHTGMTEA